MSGTYGQAGAENQDVEITPEMVAAGLAVLKNSGTVDECLEVDKLVVSEIYHAMTAAAAARKDKS